MIGLEDCAGMCGVDAAEIVVISEHEHTPEIAAAARASYLLHRANGTRRFRQMLVKDGRSALRAEDCADVAELSSVLRHLLEQHRDESAEEIRSPRWV
jgi:hypothetical protein